MGGKRGRLGCCTIMVARANHIFRAFVAVLAVYIAVVSRIPTSHCRCHEKKPVEQAAKKCPFGELRLLAQVTLLSPPIEAPAPSFVALARVVEAPDSYQQIYVPSVDVRAPPLARVV